jgi:hypothetical protein
MNDKKIQLYTIVYQLPMTNAQLFGELEAYMTNSNPEQPEPEITDFSEANAVISRYTLGNK